MGMITMATAVIASAAVILTTLATPHAAANEPRGDSAGERSQATAAAARTTLPCVPSGAGATGPAAKNFCWIDFAPIALRDGVQQVRIAVEGGHVDADMEISHTSNSVLFARDYNKEMKPYSKLIPAYRLTGKTAFGFKADVSGKLATRIATIQFKNIMPKADSGAANVNMFRDWSMAFGDAEVMSGYLNRSGYEQTVIKSTSVITRLGLIGDATPGRSYALANSGWGTKQVTLAGGQNTAGNTGSLAVAVATAQKPSSFKVEFSQINYAGDSAIAVGLYMPYSTAWRLTYDANGGKGSVPSNTEPEQLAPASASADEAGSDIAAESAAAAAEPGCRALYQEGARIRLATASTGDDCWDDGKLTKHGADGPLTFLGWSERKVPDVTTRDEVASAGVTATTTMPKGGRTVYAVWASMAAPLIALPSTGGKTAETRWPGWPAWLCAVGSIVMAGTGVTRRMGRSPARRMLRGRGMAAS
ncbi:hypothetical protein [Bifidobacterium leontopitheci]|uniref:Cell surface protein n=1 Tax=Bifidobacterium leontopitheci TaxID=2650774 RepID=A0A6I1GPC9_9BIFI|nr:hypothetical protein [Bifidobacterium leontopitheci]KAB7791239.1 hypothetical protein F7D09_0192 [Bifidobacterium leontopitheci]